MAKLMRSWLPEAVEFFYEHAGWSYMPGKETQEEGRRHCAEQLAIAEAWLSQQPGHTIEWLVDEDACREGIDHNEPLFGCIVECPGMGHARESLWGIDLGKDGSLVDPYTRVVVAELALQMMPED